MQLVSYQFLTITHDIIYFKLISLFFLFFLTGGVNFKFVVLFVKDVRGRFYNQHFFIQITPPSTKCGVTSQ